MDNNIKLDDSDNHNDNKLSPEVQKFINDNIISKEYSYNFFLNFLKETNPSKESIQDWTLEDLQFCLSDFYLQTPDTFLIRCPCMKLPPTELSKKTPSIVIRNPITVSGGLFSSNYVLYEIYTEEFKWMVMRRYSDFIWLKDCLEALFPGEYVPQLPKKQIKGRFEKEFIEKRMRHLQEFLNEVIKSENFRSADPLIKFLSLNDRTFFENQMDIMDPLNVSIDQVEEMMSVNGEKLLLNFDVNNYPLFINRFNGINAYLKANSEDIRDLKRQFKELSKCLLTATIHLDNINKIYHNLSLTNKKAELSEDITVIYEEFSSFFRNYGKTLRNQVDIINKTTLYFCYDYLKKSKEHLKLFESQESLISQYNTLKIQLDSKKESLWGKLNFRQWELEDNTNIDFGKLFNDKSYAFEKMCYKETNQLNNMQRKLGFFFHSNNAHFFNFKRQFTKELNKTLVTFTEEIGDTIREILNIWSQMKSTIF